MGTAYERAVAAAARAAASPRAEQPCTTILPQRKELADIGLTTTPKFNGADYDAERDDVRLTGQLLRIWYVIKDCQWRTLDAIAEATGDPAPSISAQLRHLRKERFGGHQIDRRHVGNGLYEYRLGRLV